MLGRAFWGRGIARQAVARMMSILVDEYDVVRFDAVVERANVRSLRLVATLGFEEAPEAVRLQRHIDGRDVLLQRSWGGTSVR